MPYRVRPDGTIEADTPEEAVALAALLARKTRGNQEKRGPRGDQGEPGEGKKNGTRRRGEPKTRGRTRRPSAAVKHGVKVGQVYKKHQGGTSGGRVIQIDQLFQAGVMPKIIEQAPGTTRKGVAKKLSYTTLRNAYKLIKDV
jgi:hypothetical protein